MASIRKLKSGRFNCQIRKKGRKPKSRSFDSFQDAERWAEMEECKASGNLQKFKDLTLPELGRMYLEQVLAGRPSQAQTQNRLDRIAERLNLPISEITKWDIGDYKTNRLKSASGTTCRDELLLVRRLYRWARSELMLDILNPCDDVALPSAGKPRNKVITPEELKLLLDNVSVEMKPVIELAYETAMRRGEILKLTPSCLHLEERVLDVIDGKTGDRTVPLTKRAIELLTEAKARCSTPSTRLFPFAPYGVLRPLEGQEESWGCQKT